MRWNMIVTKHNGVNEFTQPKELFPAFVALGEAGASSIVVALGSCYSGGFFNEFKPTSGTDSPQAALRPRGAEFDANGRLQGIQTIQQKWIHNQQIMHRLPLYAFTAGYQFSLDHNVKSRNVKGGTYGKRCLGPTSASSKICQNKFCKKRNPCETAGCKWTASGCAEPTDNDEEKKLLHGGATAANIVSLLPDALSDAPPTMTLAQFATHTRDKLKAATMGEEYNNVVDRFVVSHPTYGGNALMKDKTLAEVLPCMTKVC